MLAVCDEEILDKEFREGNIVLKVNKEFYLGTRVESVNDVLNLIPEVDIIVATGARIVQALIREGLADEKSVLKVSNQFHVQILRERV